MQICQHFLYFKAILVRLKKCYFKKRLEFPINKVESLQLRSSKGLMAICKLITVGRQDVTIDMALWMDYN